MSNNNLAKNLASEVGDLTRVPTDADDHLKLLAEILEHNTIEFDEAYMTTEKKGKLVHHDARKYTEHTQFDITHRPEWVQPARRRLNRSV